MRGMWRRTERKVEGERTEKTPQLLSQIEERETHR